MSSFKIAKDEPISDVTELNEDAFNHRAFAELIHDIVLSNEPPLTIGLFGGWGIGKTSIVHIFETICKDELKIKTGYFNAWQFSGDSFRRQFLIKIAEDIIEDSPYKKSEIENLKKLNYAKSLEEDYGDSLKDILDKRNESNFFKELFGYCKTSFSNVKFNDIGIVRTTIAILFFIFGIILMVSGLFNNGELTRWGILSILISGASFFLPKAEHLFVLKRREIFDAKLIFPEQFTEKFKKIMNHNRQNKKIVIIIDDLDRCEPETIKDTLTTIKTFLHEEQVFFLIPLDDSSILNIFSKEINNNFSYEQLRKYFSITIKIPQLSEEDLLAFAKKMASIYNIDEDIMIIAVIGDCRDARKIKHFINLYNIRYNLIKKRIEYGYFVDINIENYKIFLAKIIIIEYQYPAFYKFIMQYPNKLEIYESFSRGKNPDVNYSDYFINDQNSIEVFWQKNIGLKEFLNRTHHISNKDLHLFEKYKVPNQIKDLGEFGIALYNYLNKFIEIDFNKYDSKFLSDNEKNIVDSFHVYLHNNSTIIISQAVSLGFNIFEKLRLNHERNLSNIQVGFLQELTNAITSPINGIDIKEYLNINLDYFTYLTEIQRKDIVLKIKNEIFNENEFNTYFLTVINHQVFEEICLYDTEFINSINNTFINWYSKDKSRMALLSNLNNIKISQEERKRLKITIPSEELINACIKDLSTTNDIKTNDTNYLTSKVILNESNFPLSENCENNLSKKISEIFIANITDFTFNPTLALSIEMMINMASWLSENDAISIVNPLMSNYPNFKTNDSKQNLLLAHQICYSSMNEVHHQSIFPHYLTYLDNLNSSEFREHIDNLNKHFNSNSSTIKNALPQIIARRIDKIVTGLTTPSNDIIEDSKTLLYNINYDYICEGLSRLLFEHVFLLNNLTLLNIWGDFIEDYINIQKDQIEIDRMFDKIFNCITNKNLINEIRNFYLKCYLRSISKLPEVIASKHYQVLIQELYGEDAYLLDNIVMLINELQTIIDIKCENIKSNVSSILSAILDKNELTKYSAIIDYCLTFKDDITDDVWLKLPTKIETDIPNKTISKDYKLLLLKLSSNINAVRDKEKFSRFLYTYLNNETTDEDITLIMKDLYDSLIKERIINEYKVDDNVLE